MKPYRSAEDFQSAEKPLTACVADVEGVGYILLPPNLLGTRAKDKIVHKDQADCVIHPENSKAFGGALGFSDKVQADKFCNHYGVPMLNDGNTVSQPEVRKYLHEKEEEMKSQQDAEFRLRPGDSLLTRTIKTSARGPEIGRGGHGSMLSRPSEEN